MAPRQDPQAQFGVLGDAPLGPSAHFVQHPAADQGHGAVLDDGVALVAGDHADVEKAPVFGIHHGLEGVGVAVVVVLGRLDDGRVGRLVEQGHQVGQPVGMDAVVAVDDRHHLGFRVGMFQGVVQGPGLEPGQRFDVEKPKTRPELLAVGLHRLPDVRVTGVVVHHDHLEVRVVQGRQGIQGGAEHRRRFVVGRHMDRYHGARRIGRRNNGKGQAAPVEGPVGLRPFVGLGQQHQHDADEPGKQQQAHREHVGGPVLPAVVVDHPDGGGGRGEGRHRQEAAAAFSQRPAVEEQQGHNDQGHQHRKAGHDLPVGHRHHRRRKGELRPALGIVDPPVGPHATFEKGFPGLVEGLHHVVDPAALLGFVNKTAQEQGFVGRRGHRPHAGTAVAGPTHFTDDNRFSGEGPLQQLDLVDGVGDGLLDFDTFPEREHVHRDKIHVFRQFRVLDPHVPGFGGAHRLPDGFADLVQVGAKRVDGDFLAQHHLIAHDDPHHVAVRPGHHFAQLHLASVADQVSADPDPLSHVDAQGFGQRGDERQGALDGVGAHRMGLAGQQFQVGLDFLLARVNSGATILADPIRRKGKPLDAFRPGRFGERAVEESPKAEGHHREGDGDEQIGKNRRVFFHMPFKDHGTAGRVGSAMPFW